MSIWFRAVLPARFGAASREVFEVRFREAPAGRDFRRRIKCCDNDPVMKLASFEAIVRALEKAGVRYLVVGGLAVNAHGYLRFTKDVDFVVQLIPDNIERAFAALGALGYRPTVPIMAEQFADAALRESWIRDKGMRVLLFWSDAHRETPIDEAGGPWPRMISRQTASTGV